MLRSGSDGRPSPPASRVSGRQAAIPHLHLQGAVRSGHFAPPGKLSSGEAFAWMDRYLDSTRKGPLYLKRPEIAKIVVESIHYCVGLGHYDLHAYVVMANHVHMLVTPRIDPSSFMRSLKGFTAREINKTLGLSGALWQKESYDHWVRNEDEFDKIRRYIENNPVKAGLVSKPEDFPWSSAYIDMNVDAAR